MDSSDLARVHGQLVRVGDAFFALSTTWRSRPETPGCYSPSALAWNGRCDDIAHQLRVISEHLAASRARVYRAWAEALKEENARRPVGSAI